MARSPKVFLSSVFDPGLHEPVRAACAGIIWDPREVRQDNPQRGLYWLAKDLFDPNIQDAMEPEAQALYVIRNSLEHRYLKVHEMLVPLLKNEGTLDIWTDRLAHSVRRDDFEKKTLHLLRLARAAIIYLSLGMHGEENRRRKNNPSKIAPIPLDP
ncbi:MAG TPA: LA2681 family HEPN domain-containing protein [Xanthobacteraceae bacterium]